MLDGFGRGQKISLVKATTLPCIFSRSKNHSRFFFVVVTALLLVSFLFLTNGCSTNKQTWNDWMKANQGISSRPFLPTNSVVVSTNKLLLVPGYKIGDGARVGTNFNLAMRNPDFPRTHIAAIYIDLSRPYDGVHIQWAGPLASNAPTGPWRLTPGRGTNCVDCDKIEESILTNSACTPKGTFPVIGFADHLRLNPECLYATWLWFTPRYIAIHSHPELPNVPASSGCIRMPFATAKLIHNNSIVGVTLVNIYGKWEPPPGSVLAKMRQNN